jgi:hypothetical protein
VFVHAGLILLTRWLRICMDSAGVKGILIHCSEILNINDNILMR